MTAVFCTLIKNHWMHVQSTFPQCLLKRHPTQIFDRTAWFANAFWVSSLQGMAWTRVAGQWNCWSLRRRDPACLAFSCNCCLVGYKTELSLERYWRGQKYRRWVRRGDCFIMVYTGDIYGTCLDSLLHVVIICPLHLAGKELPVVSVIFRRSRAVWIFQCSLLWLK